MSRSTDLPPLAAQHLAVGRLTDFAPLRPICTILSPRLGVACIRHESDWERLRRSMPEIGRPPDLQRGLVVAVISLAGSPLDAAAPLSTLTARGRDDMGEIGVLFTSGNYQPDGTAYATVAFLPKLTRLQGIQVNGVRFALR